MINILPRFIIPFTRLLFSLLLIHSQTNLFILAYIVYFLITHKTKIPELLLMVSFIFICIYFISNTPSIIINKFYNTIWR